MKSELKQYLYEGAEGQIYFHADSQGLIYATDALIGSFRYLPNLRLFARMKGAVITEVS